MATPEESGRAGAWDVGRALAWGREALGAREAGLLLAHVLGIERGALYALDRRTAVGPERLRRYRRLARARRRGWPLAYLTGRAAFWDMDLAVAPGVLVPRPETEILVEAVAAALRERGGEGAVVDVGTGSGAVAIALARELPRASVYATDLSSAAVRLARANARAWAPQVRVLPPGDLLAPLVRAKAVVDAVVMNPPYVRTRDLARLPRDVVREPRLALDGGPDGLGVVRRLVAAVARGEGVRPGAGVWIEVGAGEAGAARALLAALGGPTGTIRDLAGVERVVYGSWRP
ncbi:MAG: peptide chain release factor N(5)-glutamine methyltransferase [Firmicutes bacterium]|nr:peptide chain release factor N(5)-glutamine methyltransferase [Bacillota bacterium]